MIGYQQEVKGYTNGKDHAMVKCTLGRLCTSRRSQKSVCVRACVRFVCICRKANKIVQIDEMTLIYAYFLVNIIITFYQPLLVQLQSSNHIAWRHTRRQRRRYAALSHIHFCTDRDC